jgi:hypothetical protein
MGIKNPIPVSQGVPPALQGKPTMADKIKSGDASEIPGSFEGKPENTGQYIPNGPGAIASGAVNVARGNFAKGGHQIISGIGTTTLPVAALTAPATAPAVLARGVAGGIAGSYAGGKAANYFGASQDVQDLASDLGGIAGGYAGTDLLPKAGEAMQDAGVGIINRTIGRLQADSKRGANPGLGYFQAKLGPSMSMRSIATKAANANEAAGAKLGNLYADATQSGVKIPADTVAAAINPPIKKGFSVAEGPGGTGNTGQLEDYAASFRPPLQKAAQGGGFTPSDLFDVKKNVAANTNWRDQQQFNLNKIRQQNTGAIGGTLVDAVPEAGPTNSLYQNTSVLAKRAGLRADTGSMPLTAIGRKALEAGVAGALGYQHNPMGPLVTIPAALALDSVPARTTAASALYYGGKGLAAGGGIRNLFAKP